MYEHDDDLAYERAMRMVDAPAPLSRRDGVIIPPVLYLPTRVDRAGQPSAVIWQKAGGEKALLAFTALDRLITQCGNDQSWLLMPIESLGEIKVHQPFDVIAFDPVISDRLKRDGALL